MHTHQLLWEYCCMLICLLINSFFMFSRKISTKNLFLESNTEGFLLVTENTDKI